MLSDYFLIGDIGGTNFRLYIVESTYNSSKILFTKKLKTQEIKSPENVISSFISESNLDVKRAVFAIAGPKIKNEIKMVKAPLIFNIKKLISETQLTNVELMNDMSSIAYGASTSKNIKVLKKGNPKNYFIVGAGTGLGTAYIINNKIIEAEDGHKEFEPETDFDRKHVSFLEKKFKSKKIAWGQFLNGEGFLNLYEHLSGKKSNYKEIFKRKDKKTNEFFEIYFSYYARYIGKIISKKSITGVYISSGVIQKNISRLNKENFLRILKDNTKNFEDLEIVVLLDYDVSIEGLMNYTSSIIPKVKIIPTIFALDKKTFENKLELIHDISEDIHLDFCDGKFVNTKTVPIDDMKVIKKCKNNFQIHLMGENPEIYISNIKSLGIETMMVQYEVFENNENLKKIIRKVESSNINFGLVINPETDIDQIVPILSKINLVMLMSVHPGKEGQKFIEETYSKIKRLRALNPTLTIQVDGGINDSNISKLKNAGVNNFCVGSYISSAKNPTKNYNKLKKKMF